MMRSALAAAYTANVALGSIVSISNDLAARPLGLGTGWSVERDLTVGLGAGLAAPWPMVAMLWWACSSGTALGTMTIRVLSAMFVAGALAEEATYRAANGRVSRMASIAAMGNLLIPLLMVHATVFPRRTQGT